jgi:ubiquilin
MMMGAGMPMPAGMMGSPPPSLAASQDPPEVRFQTQLLQLNDMGFWDVQANITALLRTGGNVHAAVEYLLAQPPPSSSQ